MCLSDFFKKYKTDPTKLKIQNKEFTFFLPKDISRFVDQGNLFNNFPLWAKIWEGAIVLANHISELGLSTPKSFLEIGAGVGVAGIIAASFGHNVTITDYNKDALNFACANIHKNLGDNAGNVKVKFLDWKNPNKIDKTYDYIIGSDIAYKEEDFEHILRLFELALNEKGEIILSESFRKNSLKFLQILSEKYKVRAAKKVLRSNKDETPVILIKAKPI